MRRLQIPTRVAYEKEKQSDKENVRHNQNNNELIHRQEETVDQYHEQINELLETSNESIEQNSTNDNETHVEQNDQQTAVHNSEGRSEYNRQNERQTYSENIENQVPEINNNDNKRERMRNDDNREDIDYNDNRRVYFPHGDISLGNLCKYFHLIVRKAVKQELSNNEEMIQVKKIVKRIDKNLNRSELCKKPQGIPLDTLESFNQFFEEDNVENHNQLIDFLVHEGGNDAHTTLAHFLRIIMTDEVSLNFTWDRDDKRTGRKALKDTKIADVHFTALRNCKNVTQPIKCRFNDFMQKIVKTTKERVRQRRLKQAGDEECGNE